MPARRNPANSAPPVANPQPTIGSTANAPAQRSTRVNPQHASQSGETFDLDDISGSESESDQHPIPDPIPTLAPVPAPAPIPNVTAPPEPRNAAADIRYFFERQDNKYVCKPCRIAKETDPANWPSNINFEYSSKTSTTSLRPHIEKYHLEEYMAKAKENRWKILLPGLVSQAKSQGSANLVENERVDKFTDEKFHQYLLKFIVANDQSINVVECPEFRALLLLLRDELKDSMVPHRTKMRELIVDAWKRYFITLKEDLSNALGRISCTADIWSDQSRSPYLAVTAHWMASTNGRASIQNKMALIAFHRVRGRHDGKSLANTLVQLLDRAGITVNIGHITLDNCSSNGTMMQWLQTLLREREIEFDANDRRVMCFGHVIDLSSGRIIKGLSNSRKDNESDNEDGSSSDDNDDNNDDDDDDGDNNDDDDDEPPTISLVRTGRNPVVLARSVVRVIRASGARRDAFKEVIENGNSKQWWKDSDGKPFVIKPLQLLRDVRTRWDSVYYMLNRLRELQPAVDYFLALPNNKDLAKYTITAEEWSAMRDLEIILSVPHRVQQTMSGEHLPVLAGAIPAFEMFMTNWEKLSGGYPHLKEVIQNGLDWAYKYYARMDRTQAYIVAMLINPAIRMSWVHKHWDQNYIEDAEAKILQTMRKYKETATTANEPPALVPVIPCNQTPAYMSLGDQYGLGDDMDIGDSAVKTQSVEHEYQAYITAPLSSKNVDIVKFWEVNGANFPTLFAIAMDYLPIQASAVPCERIFSSSAETDTKKRNRISPVLMEALQMLKLHLKKERLSFTNAWMTAENEMTQDVPDDDLLQKLFEATDPQRAMDDAIRSTVY